MRSTEVRSEEGANAGPVGARRVVERAVAAGEVVAKGQLGMSRVRVAEDEGVAREGKFARAEGADDPAAGLGTGAHEDNSAGYVVAAVYHAAGGH